MSNVKVFFISSLCILLMSGILWETLLRGRNTTNFLPVRDYVEQQSGDVLGDSTEQSNSIYTARIPKQSANELGQILLTDDKGIIRPLRSNAEYSKLFTWSPDNQYLVAEKVITGKQTSLIAINVNDGTETKLSDKPISFVSWPTDKTIILQQSNALTLMEFPSQKTVTQQLPAEADQVFFSEDGNFVLWRKSSSTDYYIHNLIHNTDETFNLVGTDITSVDGFRDNKVVINDSTLEVDPVSLSVSSINKGN